MQVGKDLKEENFQATSQYSSKGEHHAKVQWKFGISLHTINIELHHIFCTHPLKRESRKGGRAQTEGSHYIAKDFSSRSIILPAKG